MAQSGVGQEGGRDPQQLKDGKRAQSVANDNNVQVVKYLREALETGVLGASFLITGPPQYESRLLRLKTLRG